MIDPAELERRIVDAFPDAQVKITDLTGTRDHYSVSIVTATFRGHSRIQQHKLVYAALADLMRGPIHALSLDTRAP